MITIPLPSARTVILLPLLPTLLLADRPASPSSEQLSEIDRHATPAAPNITAAREEMDKAIERYNTRAAAIDKAMRPFLEDIRQSHLLLATADQPDTQVNEPTTPPATPAAEQTGDKPAGEKEKKTTTLRVECDGGIYFDSENGILAYLKNIRLTEPRFTLTCSDQLKVFLEKKADTAATASDTTNKPATPQDGTAEKTKDGVHSFGDLRRIIASGNVKVVRKDERGKPFIASAATASYDAKTEQMILKGGRLRLQQSANQYLEARTKDAFILIKKNGSFTTSDTGWVMETTTSKPRPNTP